MAELISGYNLVANVTYAECVQCQALYTALDIRYTFAYKRKESVSSNFMINNFC